MTDIEALKIETAVTAERARCIKIIRDVLADRKMMRDLTSAGLLLAIGEQIVDPKITSIKLSE